MFHLHSQIYPSICESKHEANMTKPHERSLQVAYDESNRTLRLRNLKIGLGIALFLVSVFSVLDWMTYPDQFLDLFFIRAVCLLVLFCLLTSLYTRLNLIARYVQLASILYTLTLSVSVCWMIMITEGAASPYYAGLNLIILAVSLLLPWTLLESVTACSGTILIYMGACFIHDLQKPTINPDWIGFYNNLFFLVSTALIGIVASHFQSLRRFEMFRLTYELESKNKELAELDRKKSDFYANINHELRTPLGLIIAPLQDLLQTPYQLPDKVVKFLVTARDNGMRLWRLVNDLLDLIRLDARKEQFHIGPIHLNALISSQIDGMVHYAQSKHVTVQNLLVSHEVVVLGDQEALEHIFINLLSNAAKFTEAGGRITVRSHSHNGAVCVEVEDTGVGIPHDQLPLIFDRFHQVDSSSTRRHHGTGLGLTMAKELTERLGGQIQVASDLGKGTTVSVTLPVAELPAEVQPQTAPPEAMPEDPLQRLQREAHKSVYLPLEDPSPELAVPSEQDPRPTLLVVDDEPDMRRYLTATLADTYRVIEATDGRRGLDLVQQQRPDLMVLDLMLPELDGLEVCRRLKQNQDTRGVKVVLLTARVDEEAKLAALRNGANDFLTKPFSSLEVKTRLQNLLQQATLERELHQRNQDLQNTLGQLRQTQGQLLHNQKLAGLGSMAAGLLHEVQNPLNYVLTATTLMRGEEAIQRNPDLKEMLEDIGEGVGRIKQIVAGLDTFAHPSGVDAQKPFSFRHAVEQAVRFTAHERGDIPVQVTLCGDDTVLGSESHIVQVLINLLNNGIKAVKSVPNQHSPNLRVSAQTENGRLGVQVQDNGVGIEADRLSRIFDPFYTTSVVGEGMGLGLSICHTIVQHHGSALRVDSEPGQWTSLYFDLPMAYYPSHTGR